MEVVQVARYGISPEMFRTGLNPELYGSRKDPIDKTNTESEKNRSLLKIQR